MADYMVRFQTAEKCGGRPCMECGDPTEVVYTYTPAPGVKIHAPYCFDCAYSLGIIERVSDYIRRKPEDAFRLRLRRNTDLTHYSEGTWWVGREGGNHGLG